MHRNYGAESATRTSAGERELDRAGVLVEPERGEQPLEAAAVGFLPLHQVLPLERGLSAFLRVGGYRATLTPSERGVADHSNFGWGYGAGLQMDFGRKIGLRAQWQRYKNVGGGDYLKQNYDVLGLSALYRFQ